MRLGDVLHVKHGFAFRSEFFGTSGEYIVVTPGNFRDEGGFKHKSGQEKFYTAKPPAEFVLRSGDLIVAMTEQTQGLIGSSAIVPDHHRYLHNQRIGLVEVSAAHLAHKQFLYYLFNTGEVRRQLEATATGAKVRHTAPARIQAVRVSLPPLGEQQRIASILSAYDNLIENNTRRIQILEEMAQAIYREWFVEFRFPGHEGVRMVDSELGPIPEGWKVQLLDDVAGVNADVIRNGEGIRDINYIDISAVSEGEFSWKHMPYRSAPGRARRVVVPYDVIWSTVRPNLRAYALVCEPPSNCIASTGFAVLTARSVPWSYLYSATTTRTFVNYLANHATGAAYPAVTGRIFEGAPMMVPDDDTLTGFHRLVGPRYRLIAKLRSASGNLRQTRDLLLPRLISGEIDVSDLDVGNAEPAA